MSEVATRGDIHPAIHEHYKEMNGALHERDELHTKATDLHNKLEVANRLIEEYKSQLDILRRERDHYMRHSLALVTRINAVRDIMLSTLELAEDEALKPGPMKISEKELLEALADEAAREANGR